MWNVGVFFFFKYVDGEMRENIVDGENKYKGETKIRKRGEFIEIRMIFWERWSEIVGNFARVNEK